MQINGILTIWNSKRDKYGNVYYAIQLERDGGLVTQGRIGCDNVSTLECREVLHWHIQRYELPIREFNRHHKGWSYIGSQWEEVRDTLAGKKVKA